MTSLTVWKFNTPEGAEQALDKLKSLSKQELVTIEDAAIVTWKPGKKKPKTKQLHSMSGSGALGGTFWGLLFGLLFFAPLMGAAIGAGIGALVGHFSDYGIDDDFIKTVKTEVTEGTSALFLLISKITDDKVSAAFEGTQMKLIQSNLTAEQEAKLQTDFAEE